MGSRPAGLMKLAMARLPTVCGCVLPGTVTATAPSALMVTLVALAGMVMPLTTGSPLDVTMRPWASTWNEPSRV